MVTPAPPLMVRFCVSWISCPSKSATRLVPVANVTVPPKPQVATCDRSDPAELSSSAVETWHAPENAFGFTLDSENVAKSPEVREEVTA